MSSSAPEPVQHPTPLAAEREDDLAWWPWLRWLRQNIEKEWRPNEWDRDAWLFQGDPSNPTTSLRLCEHPDCESVAGGNGYCSLCARRFAQSGMSRSEFNDSVVVPAIKAQPNRPVGCAVPACAREQRSRKLCMPHYERAVRLGRPDAADDEAWLRGQSAAPTVPSCRVRGCRYEARSSVSKKLCPRHAKRLKDMLAADPSQRQQLSLMDWLEREPPLLSPGEFSLAPLSDIVRLEFLYVLQERDRRGEQLRTDDVKWFITRIADADSLALSPELLPDPDAETTPSRRSFAKIFRRYLGYGLDQSRGIKETDKLVWDLALIDSPLKSFYTKNHVHSGRGHLDFRVIEQEWLRSALIAWTTANVRYSKRVKQHIKACEVASLSLLTCPGGGHEPSELTYANMTAVCEGFREMRKRDGALAGGSHRSLMFKYFEDVLHFGRSEGLLDDLSSRFVRSPKDHRIGRADPDEGEVGRALPDVVIRQLNEGLWRLTSNRARGCMSADNLAQLYRTMYIVLRDTGRRPSEVARLRLDCLAYVDGSYELIWDNTKAGRLNRRLPLGNMECIQAIKDWIELRRAIDVPNQSKQYLFPAITDDSALAYIDPVLFNVALRDWIDEAMPRIDSDEPGPDGEPLPFDRTKIVPYAFRHSFCQRMADAGVPMHVLQQLMDHKSPATTMTYFRVPFQQKKEAIERVGSLATDRFGTPMPIGDEVSYEIRAVAVPFGNCIEPSNVKAGGGACPIRFQCSGCASYRPDPSHLLAIEDHIRALRATLELQTAAGAAEFVLRNLQDQVDAFEAIRTAQVQRLSALSDEERQEIEEASRIVRRFRAGRQTAVDLPMPTLGRRVEESDD